MTPSANQMQAQYIKLRGLSGLLAYAYTVALTEWKRRYPARPRPMLDTTHRTNKVQAELYAQGRTKPGPIVTHALPGQSKHNKYPAEAFDIKFVNPDGSVDWDEDLFDDFWDCICTADCGVYWGGLWSGKKIDRPHFELM